MCVACLSVRTVIQGKWKKWGSFLSCHASQLFVTIRKRRERSAENGQKEDGSKSCSFHMTEKKGPYAIPGQHLSIFFTSSLHYYNTANPTVVAGTWKGAHYCIPSTEIVNVLLLISFLLTLPWSSPGWSPYEMWESSLINKNSSSNLSYEFHLNFILGLPTSITIVFRHTTELTPERWACCCGKSDDGNSSCKSHFHSIPVSSSWRYWIERRKLISEPVG